MRETVKGQALRELANKHLIERAEKQLENCLPIFSSPELDQRYFDIAINSWQIHNPNGRVPVEDHAKDMTDWLVTDLATLVSIDQAHSLPQESKETILGLPPIIEDREPDIDDSWGWYIHQYAEHRLLSAAEEVQLAWLVQWGLVASKIENAGLTTAIIRQTAIDGMAACADLVRYNQKLVIDQVMKHHSEYLTRDDLVQAGNLGLVKGIERYDPRKGWRFSTYATHWIRQSISRTRYSSEHLIHLPAQPSEDLRQYDKAVQRLIATNKPVTIKNLMQETGLKRQKILLLRNFDQNQRRPVSLATLVDQKGTIEMEEILEDEAVIQIDIPVENQQLRRTLQEVLGELTPSQAYVLDRRFGLTLNEPMTLEAIGKELGLTRERIRQIESGALRKLRSPKLQHQLRDYHLKS